MKKKMTELKLEEEEVKEEPKEERAVYFGYRVIEDNNVNELRLPADVIELLSTATAGFDYSKAELIPDKYYTCPRCGFKMQGIKGKQASMFFCPRDGKRLISH